MRTLVVAGLLATTSLVSGLAYAQDATPPAPNPLETRCIRGSDGQGVVNTVQQNPDGSISYYPQNVYNDPDDPSAGSEPEWCDPEDDTANTVPQNPGPDQANGGDTPGGDNSGGTTPVVGGNGTTVAIGPPTGTPPTTVPGTTGLRPLRAGPGRTIIYINPNGTIIVRGLPGTNYITLPWGEIWIQVTNPDGSSGVRPLVTTPTNGNGIRIIYTPGGQPLGVTPGGQTVILTPAPGGGYLGPDGKPIDVTPFSPGTTKSVTNDGPSNSGVTVPPSNPGAGQGVLKTTLPSIDNTPRTDSRTATGNTTTGPTGGKATSTTDNKTMDNKTMDNKTMDHKTMESTGNRAATATDTKAATAEEKRSIRDSGSTSGNSDVGRHTSHTAARATTDAVKGVNGTSLGHVDHSTTRSAATTHALKGAPTRMGAMSSRGVGSSGAAKMGAHGIGHGIAAGRGVGMGAGNGVGVGIGGVRIGLPGL